MRVPFDKDLSHFADDDLRATLRWLRRGWCKPWLWGTIIPAYVAIRYELEWREACDDQG